MGIAQKLGTKLRDKWNLLVSASDAASQIPMNLALEVAKVAEGLMAGARPLRRPGPGKEFESVREWRAGDDPREVAAASRFTARNPRGDVMVAKKAREVPQHVFLGVCGKDRMNEPSRDTLFTKRQAAHIQAVALAKHLTRADENMVGLIGGKGVHSGSRASHTIAQQLETASLDEMPIPSRRLPPDSTVVLFNDFMMELEDIRSGLDRIMGAGLRGFLVMILHPHEIDFDFRGNVDFECFEGSGKENLRKAEEHKDEYKSRLAEHVSAIRDLCGQKGFNLIVQRTDEPLHYGLLELLGGSPGDVTRKPVPGMGMPAVA